jgi:hypothetical protein
MSIMPIHKTDDIPPPKIFGVYPAKPGSDRSVEVIGRVREDGSVEVLGIREPAEKGREAGK